MILKRELATTQDLVYKKMESKLVDSTLSSYSLSYYKTKILNSDLIKICSNDFDQIFAVNHL